jgi:SAM-dependent methyltransferase
MNPHALVETLQAYKRTSLLRAAVELKVFDALADGPAHAADVATTLGLPQRSTRIFLGALAAVGLLDSDGKKFTLPPGAETLLVSTSPQYRGNAAKVIASDLEWDSMRDLAAIVSQGETPLAAGAETADFPYWVDFAGQATFVTKAATAAMTDTLRPWARERRNIRLLDVGCGHALFGLTFARHFPDSRVWALDWSNVLPLASAQAEALGVSDRVTLLPGDAFTADLAGPHDLVVLANFLPLFSAERGTELLRRVSGVLEPGGRIAIVGFAVGEGPPADDLEAHLLSLLMLAWTSGGKAHSVGTYRRMLATTGFTDIRVCQVTDLPMYVLVAEWPAR